jgi:hypothetical protein
MRNRVLGILLFLLASSGPVLAQGSVAGTITGVVTDSQGSVIEGATISVSSPAMMKPRSQQTVAGGTYLIEQLPPGEYQLTCSMPGFRGFLQKGVVLTAGFTATVKISLSLGETSETVTVTGLDPVVDVQSSSSPTTFDSSMLQNTPSGRDPWSTLAQTPGVTTSTFDVGGNQSYQQSSMSVHGSKTTETVYAFNGLNLNGPSGTSTGFYVDYDSFQEVQVLTDAAPAEVPIGGAYLNMITRSGSNQVHGFAAAYYLSNATQASLTPPRFNGSPVLNAGSPFTMARDITGNAGGPIIRDRWWVFGAYRLYDLKQTLLSSQNLDGTHGTDVNHQTNITFRNDVEINAKNLVNLQWLYNEQNRFFRRPSFTYVDQVASWVQIEPAYILSAQETYAVSAHFLIDSRIGYMQVVFPERYQPGVSASTIEQEDSSISSVKYAAPYNYLNKEKVGRVASTASYFKGGWAGSHNFKFGFETSIARNYTNYDINQNINEIFNNGVPFEVRVNNTSTRGNSWAHGTSFFLQDAWTIGRKLTLSIGGRFDESHAFLAEQCSPSILNQKFSPLFPNRCLSQYKTATSTNPITDYSNVDTFNNIVPRISVAFDPNGKGNQVIRAGFNMFTLNAGTALADAVNPNTLNYNLYLWNGATMPGSGTSAPNSATPDPAQYAPGCSATVTIPGCIAGGTAPASNYKGTAGGITTYIDPHLKRPYSEQFNVGYQRSVFRDISIGVAYYYRTNKNLYAPVNINAPTGDYTPINTLKGAAIVNPYTGAPLTLYNLNTADVGKNYYKLTQVPDLNNNRYDGVEFTATKRMAHRWQALVGFTMQKNRGTYYGSATAGASEDFNDPNRGINRYNGSLDQDAPFVLRADATYLFPLSISSSINFQHETGYPLLPTVVVTGLNQGSETIKLATNGALRLDSVNDANLRISRPTHLGDRYTLEPLMDLNNLFNSNPVIAKTVAYGANFLKPSNVLGPFVARFGLKLSF